jgi:acyl transferase domain-containing protein
METRRTDNTPLQIAIVGLAGLFPALPGEQGESRDAELERFWKVVRDGRSVAREVPEGRWLLNPDDIFDPEVGMPDKAYSRRACFLDRLPTDSDLADLPLNPNFLATADPLYRLTLHVGRQAFSEARLDHVDRSRIGVILGNLALPTEKSSALAHELLGCAFEEHVLRTLDCSSLLPTTPEKTPFKSHPLNRCVTGLPAGILAYALGLGGGAYTLDAACASSLYAIKLAANALLSGQADAMLAGGVSRPDCLYTQMGFSQLRALSATGVCAPFDAQGNGLVVGEGAGIFVLKRLDDALKAGDTIYAVLQGAGLSNDIGGKSARPDLRRPGPRHAPRL